MSSNPSLSPFLSVILPTYNRKYCISKMIDSVLGQSFGDFELIIVDDGSTDGTLDFLKEKYSDERIVIVQKENGGVSSARNLGISMAKGEFITFVDSDDYLLDGFFEDIFRISKLNCHIDVMVFPNFIAGKNKLIESNIFFKDKTTWLRKIQDEIHTNTTFIRYFCLFFGNPNVCSKVFKHCIAREVTFCENLSFGEDLLFVFQILFKSKRIFTSIQARYYIYNTLETSLTRGGLKDGEKVAQLLNAFCFLKHHPQSSTFIHYIAFNYVKHLRFYMVQLKAMPIQHNKVIFDIFEIILANHFYPKREKIELSLLLLSLKSLMIRKLLYYCYQKKPILSMLKFTVKILNSKDTWLWICKNICKIRRGGG